MKRKLLLSGLALAALSLMGASGPVAAQGTQFVTFGGGSVGGAFYVIAAGMAHVVEKNVPNVKATARATNATIENVRLLGRKQLEFALAAADGPYNALHASGPFDKEKYDNIRYIATGYASILQVMVPSGSPIRSLADLKGKKIGVLVGITVQDWFPRITEVVGIKGQFDPRALRAGELMTDLRDNNIDAAVYWGAAPTAEVTDLARSRDLRFLPTPANVAQEVIRTTHPFFSVAPLEKGMYRGVDADIPSMAVPILLVTHAEVPDTLVYQVTKTLMERNDELAAIHPNAKAFNLAGVGSSMVIPPHPGAARYFAERNIKLP